MTDRRRLRSNGVVAHRSLEGQVEAERFVDGEPARVAAVVADLCPQIGGPRDRQLLRGEVFVGLEARDGHVFGYAEKDGYVGWVEGAAFVGHPEEAPTHSVAVGRSYLKTTPGLKEMGRVIPLTFGVQLTVLEMSNSWAKIAWARGLAPKDMFVPSAHLVDLDKQEVDPVSVAERLLHTPYLWGGNSSFGIDCSGLVQAACLACGRPCPGDSDMQEAALGALLPQDAPLKRGDLLYWKGHVAWVVDAETLIHANAHHMAVAYEPMDGAIRRIEAQGGGPVTARKRLEI